MRGNGKEGVGELTDRMDGVTIDGHGTDGDDAEMATTASGEIEFDSTVVEAALCYMTPVQMEAVKDHFVISNVTQQLATCGHALTRYLALMRNVPIGDTRPYRELCEGASSLVEAFTKAVHILDEHVAREIDKFAMLRQVAAAGVVKADESVMFVPQTSAHPSRAAASAK